MEARLSLSLGAEEGTRAAGPEPEGPGGRSQPAPRMGCGASTPAAAAPARPQPRPAAGDAEAAPAAAEPAKLTKGLARLPSARRRADPE